MLTRPNRLFRWLGFGSLCAGFAFTLMCGSAMAADQFTIDSSPDSFGAVVTDAAGNGYVAWEHLGTGGAADTPMFCKLPPGARRCAHPIALSLPDASVGGEADANQLFPILGPGSTVWVVTSRYVLDDTLIWTSSNGGASFGGAWEIPYVPFCPQPPEDYPPCKVSYSYADGTTIDDALPITPDYATYDGQVYETDTGQPSVNWLESSSNPSLGFNLDDTAETSGGVPNASEFDFINAGGGGIGGSALGTTKTGYVVEAYWLETTPYLLGYYVFSASTLEPITPQGSGGWYGPMSLGDGYLPRMADGAKGLFLLSADGSGAIPDRVDIRKFNASKHWFDGPRRVTDAGDASIEGGGLAENYTTGELAVVWPTFNDTNDLMRLYVSTDGAARFSKAQYIARVSSTYPIRDNARVAIAPKGTGFVTFLDGNGLEVADLFPISANYGTLAVHGVVVKVPVTCTAPKGYCRVILTLTHGSPAKLAASDWRVRAGTTRSLKLDLNPGAITLLDSHHHRLQALLTVVIHLPGVKKANTTTSSVTLSGP